MPTSAKDRTLSSSWQLLWPLLLQLLQFFLIPFPLEMISCWVFNSPSVLSLVSAIALPWPALLLCILYQSKITTKLKNSPERNSCYQIKHWKEGNNHLDLDKMSWLWTLHVHGNINQCPHCSEENSLIQHATTHFQSEKFSSFFWPD